MIAARSFARGATRAAALALALATAACGTMDRGGAPEAEAFRATAERIDAAAAAYGGAATAAADREACLAAHSGYDGDVRPMLGELREMAARMDEHMAGTAHPEYADMTCAADAMMAELDRHAAEACAAALPADDAAEASAHVERMRAWARHQRIRAEYGAGMGGGMMGGDGMDGMDHAGACTAEP